DYFRFYEIDPQVIGYSVDPRLLGFHHSRPPIFTFLEDSRATIDIAPGDARLSLEKEAEDGQLQHFDVMALDAFSSDSIPIHLLTREAVALYLRHLSGPDAVLAFHLSNRALDLKPVVAGLTREYGLSAVEVHKTGFSDWVLASRNPEILKIAGEYSQPLETGASVPLWTDDYSNLIQVVRKNW
ncbi:MAG: ferrichrome ABC transporter permease, partial [Acidobacteria bacterium]|nr:ferrichrome ABC transporter permease [Acidobacteriota bacterium]